MAAGRRDGDLQRIVTAAEGNELEIRATRSPWGPAAVRRYDDLGREIGGVCGAGAEDSRGSINSESGLSQLVGMFVVSPFRPLLCFGQLTWGSAMGAQRRFAVGGFLFPGWQDSPWKVSSLLCCRRERRKEEERDQLQMTKVASTTQLNELMLEAQEEQTRARAQSWRAWTCSCPVPSR